MRVRNVLKEFEAHLHGVPPGSKLRGKSEWKQYGDGIYHFKFYVANLPLPDGSQIDLWRDGSWIMRLMVQNRKASVVIENDTGSGIPAIHAGQVVQVRCGEIVLADGTYEAE